jgi:hypothetical protein
MVYMSTRVFVPYTHWHNALLFAHFSFVPKGRISKAEILCPIILEKCLYVNNVATMMDLTEFRKHFLHNDHTINP